MVRTIWKGDISFGLVSIPIGILPVEDKNKDLHFHLLDPKDKSRIRYQRINSNTGKEVPWNEIVKGYEYDKNSYIIVDEDTFEKASPEVFKSIDIEEFVDFDEIDPLYFNKLYYIVPDSKNKKAYVLLREALKKTNKVGVAKVIIRTKEHLSIIMAHDEALLLNLLHFKDEIREEDELNLPKDNLKAYKISEREIKMAISLIKDMTTKWKPEKYHDDYQEALEKWLAVKIKEASKKQPKKTNLARKNTDVEDFITLLKQSMAKKGKIKQGAKSPAVHKKTAGKK